MFGSRLTLALWLLPVFASSAQDYRAAINAELPTLLAIYKDLHAHPELSYHEERTSVLLANELRKSGYAVTEHVGKYADSKPAYGLVAILKNGTGPTVLVRTELDALPVEEKTGLPYASKIRTRDDAGETVGVMHDCGHDLHLACFLGTARTLAAVKDRWHGTLMLIGQPAEERIDGPRSMLRTIFMTGSAGRTMYWLCTTIRASRPGRWPWSLDQFWPVPTGST